MIQPFPGVTNVTLDSPCFSYSFSVPDSSAPQILSSPVSQDVGAETMTCLSVQASGAQGYQWQKDGANLTDQDRITGATSATLCLADLQPDDSGSYTVTLSNACGMIVTEGALLRVNSNATLRVAGFTPTEGFTVTVLGVRDLNYVVEAATDLGALDWVPVVTNTAPFTYTDATATNFPPRFYRAIWLP